MAVRNLLTDRAAAPPLPSPPLPPSPLPPMRRYRDTVGKYGLLIGGNVITLECIIVGPTSRVRRAITVIGATSPPRVFAAIKIRLYAC